MVTTDLHSCPADDLLAVPKTDITTTEFTATAGSSVVAIHQDHIAFGVDEQSTELPARAVGGIRQGEALLDAYVEMFLFHREFLGELAGRLARIGGLEHNRTEVNPG
jgi:hypothetical protein